MEKLRRRCDFLFLGREEDGFSARWEDSEAGFGIEAAEGLGLTDGERAK